MALNQALNSNNTAEEKIRTGEERYMELITRNRATTSLEFISSRKFYPIPSPISGDALARYRFYTKFI